MAAISRSNVYDVLANKPRDRVAVFGGKRRIIKRPEGRLVREFVDLVGNIVWLQVLRLGTNQGEDAMDAALGKYRRRGFLETRRCPVKHGTRFATDKLSAEFGEMPEDLQRTPCTADPKLYTKRGGHTHAGEPCPHIQWIIADRRRREAERLDLRRSQTPTPIELERQKIALQEQQLEEMRKQNATIVKTLEAIATPATHGAPKKRSE